MLRRERRRKFSKFLKQCHRLGRRGFPLDLSHFDVYAKAIAMCTVRFDIPYVLWQVGERDSATLGQLGTARILKCYNIVFNEIMLLFCSNNRRSSTSLTSIASKYARSRTTPIDWA